MIKFSVIIPLYNKALYIAKAISSVLSQTFTDYELVIMDDGSRDDSFDVAQKAIEGHDNCFLYKQDNDGVSAARNNAVALSQCDYLCFLDADDWWDSNYLMEMSRLINEFPDAGIYGVNYTIINETKHKTRIAPIGVGIDFEKGYINYCQVYANTMAMPLWTGAVCVPRLVFNEMQGFPKGIKLGEDFLLWIRIALKYKVAFLNKALAFYNQDVDIVNRGVGKLYEPKEHMLWNLTNLEHLEQINTEYKQLVDNLRIYGLYPYYLSKDYHKAAVVELNKVDWSRQSKKVRKQYTRPLFVQRGLYTIKKMGSRVKSKLLCVLYK